MTERLYFQDAFMKEFTAVVQEAAEGEAGFRIRLDRTAFYPEGGGQPSDTGWLETADGRRIEITDVRDAEEEIWHIAAEAVQPGEEVKGILNFESRFDHMQQHSGEHIVSGMICSRFHCNNVGFHLGEDVTTIDFDVRIPFEEALAIEAEANRYIWENHAFEQNWYAGEELKAIEYRSKKELEGNVRIASFPGADRCACCGTHVAESAQIGLVKFISAKNFHEGTRLELLCGKRAYDFLAMNFTQNKAVAVKLSASEDKTAEYLDKLLEETVRFKGEVNTVQEELLGKWAESFQPEERILVLEDWMTPLLGRKLADLAADRCKAVAVFSTGKEGRSYALICRGSDISGFVKEMNAALDGRGGGRDGFAQGSVKADPDQIAAFMEAHQFRRV